jgi:4-hydroxybenzoate polyprenyltransferase
MPIKSYLKIVRLPDLIFIAFIQYAMYRAIIIPLLMTGGFDDISNYVHLGLLILSTVFIAAGGFVLNDYFDVKIDRINRPDKMIVDQEIPRRKAMIYYQILTAIGIICGLILSWWAKSFTLALIFIITPGLLWFYSSSYKRQLLIGNLVIAFLSAICILLPSIMELAFLKIQYGNLIYQTPLPKKIYSWTSGFAFFAFLCTFIREIIKDMEDIEGDKELECRTLPIVWGVQKTKNLIYLLIIFVIVSLMLTNNFLIPFQGTFTLKYIIFGLVIPFFCLAFLIAKSKSQKDFHQAATFLKIIMLIGVLYSFVFYFLEAKEFDIPFFNVFISSQ